MSDEQMREPEYGVGPLEMENLPGHTRLRSALSEMLQAQSMLQRLVFIAICAVVPIALASARPVPLLSYRELVGQCDVALIVRATETRDAVAGDPIAATSRESSLQYLTPVVTTFRVLATIKGEYTDERFTLPHFRFDMAKATKNGLAGVGNGPNLALFNVPEKDHDSESPMDGDAIIFLKRIENDSLVPITGQFDSAFSVIRVRR